ncbi:MAG: SH3 domain-containing protein [Alphaproteobacteria bacterium]
MKKVRPRHALAAVVLGAALAAAEAQEKPPLPRFASLRSDEVNLRAGPGKQYPVEWVFVRRSLPVEVFAEYGPWRKIRDIDGSEGWVHSSLLSTLRSVIVADGTRTLRRTPDDGAQPLLRAEAGVLGKLLACERAWCRVEIAGEKGWMPRRHLWGVYAEEVVK